MAELATVAMVTRQISPAGGSSAVDAAYVTELLDRAEETMRTLCNRPDGWLNTSAHTETFGGDRTCGRIILKHTPVTAITSVKVFASSGNSSTFSSSLYRIDTAASALLFTPRYGDQSLASFMSALDVAGYIDGDSVDADLGIAYPYTEVVYTGGYANQAAVPKDLVQAAIRVCQILYNESRGTSGGERARYSPSEINDAIAAVCRPYVRMLGVG